MCGIVGLAGACYDPDLLGRMNALLTHRGPDDAGHACDDGPRLGLAMRRLAILDLAGGRQPMRTEDDALAVVHNGEIFNTPELRERLTQRGYPLRTSHSDTEALLYLYRERGTDMPSDLNGMFAFVIFDRERNRLFGARDRFGIKPLYYTRPPGGFAFASELKALLPLPHVRREVDPASLYHYVSLEYVPGERSILPGILRLPPAHAFTYDLATHHLATWRYWDLDVTGAEARPAAEQAAALREALGQAAERWMLSDVPVGCSLSGGLDSSALVGLLAERGHTVRTYSVGFAGPEEAPWNELPLARQVARRWGTEHHEIVLQPEDLLRDLVRMVWHLDEPYGGGLPSWHVFQFMRQHVTVGLTGAGGDELFGNYGKARVYEDGLVARGGGLLRRLPGGPAAARVLLQALPMAASGQVSRLRDLAVLAGGPRMAHYLSAVYPASDDAKRAHLLEPAVTAGVEDTARHLEHWFERAGRADLRAGLAYVDIHTQLADEFLHMIDRLSMAHSLEARVPYLDHLLVEHVFHVPSDQRAPLADPKALLKRAVGDLLPPDLLRAPKRGFIVPTTLWLRGPLRPLAERLLAPERLRRQGLFQPTLFEAVVRPHLEGRADHTARVWSALMFQLWWVVFVEEGCREVPSFTWSDLLGGR